MSTKSLVFLALASLSVSCGAEPGDITNDGEINSEVRSDLTFETPPEVVWRGTRLLRIDTLSEQELVEIRGASLQRGLSEEALIAEQLRPLVNYHGVPYIGAEPARELARKILVDRELEQEPSPEALPLEGRRILGSGAASGDQRVHRGAHTTPWSHTGFSEIGCTMTLIGKRTAVTAAHCVYSTFDTASPPPAGQIGWVCQDGTNSGSISTGCGTYPRFAFGVEDTTLTLGWITSACSVATIPVAWDTNVNDASRSDWNDVARHDYAVVDFSACYVNMGLGYMGNHPDVSLSGKTFNLWGYPQYATCPQNAVGTSTDCGPETNNRYADTTKPYQGAELWGNSTGSAAVGTNNDVLQSEIDITPGDSGSALFYVHSTAGFQLTGIASGEWNSKNWFKRWTTATSNFVAANSDFPSDL